MAEQDKLGMAAEWEQAAPVANSASVPDPPPPQKFTREIDTGDGRGKQVFEAESYEALVDKLVEAQAHATRKIGELDRLSRQNNRRMEPEKRSSDFVELQGQQLKEEQILQLQTQPHQLFRHMFQAETGLSPEEFRMRENDRRRREAEMEAQNAFVTRHSGEYVPSQENAQKIMRFLQNENLPVSRRNLDYAFDQLRTELASAPRTTGELPKEESKPTAPPARQISPPPSTLRASFGEPSRGDTSGGIDAAEIGRIAQLPPGEMKARIEQIFRSRAR